MVRLQSKLEYNVGHSQYGEEDVGVVPGVLEIVKALFVKLDQVIARGVDDTHHHQISVGNRLLLTVYSD